MRKYLMVTLALVFALGSAFTFRQSYYQFRFDGASTNWEDRVDESMYTKIDISCGGPEVKLCEISALDVDADNLPDIGSSGSLYNALRNGETTQPNFLQVGVTGKP